ncbi:MAG: DUF1844 domain-containing protein [Planctomycetota bacterium]
MSDSRDESGEVPGGDVPYPPPADFRLFLEGFIGQALVSLGKIPHPVTQQTEVNLPWAKYFIDLLGLLDEKTRGNLDKEEESMLRSQISMLRLTYVDTQKEAGSPAPVEEPSSSTEEDGGEQS